MIFFSTISKTFLITVLHSLWQGGFFIILAALMLTVTKNKSSRIRYNSLIVLLGCFLTSITITFFWCLLLSHSATDKVHTYQSVSGSLTKNSTFQSINNIYDWLKLNARYVLALWLTVTVWKFIRLYKDFHKISLLKANVSELSVAWQNRVSELCAHLSINEKVHIVESKLIKVPVLIGYLKPFIILPLGLVSNLPLREVEAIILHELAHILRKDYLVNIIQTWIETIFFFNPAVLWISSQIRIERENCCDDIAISALSDKETYINALILFEEMRFAAPCFANAFMGHKNFLLGRIERILHGNNKMFTAMEKLFISFTIVFIFSFTISRLEYKRKPTAAIRQNPIISLQHQSESRLYSLGDTLPERSKKKQQNLDTDRIQRTFDVQKSSNDRYDSLLVVSRSQDLKQSHNIFPQLQKDNDAQVATLKKMWESFQAHVQYKIDETLMKNKLSLNQKTKIVEKEIKSYENAFRDDISAFK